jgi:hypothetical protein
MVSVIMFTPNGVVVPSQQIRVAGNSLDLLEMHTSQLSLTVVILT